MSLMFISKNLSCPPFLSLQQSLDFHESREAEPHPLWEYPCRALTQSKAVMTFDFTQCVPQQPIISQGSLPLIRYSLFHSVLNPDSTGLFWLLNFDKKCNFFGCKTIFHSLSALSCSSSCLFQEWSLPRCRLVDGIQPNQ